jgi:hypothetical protein
MNIVTYIHMTLYSSVSSSVNWGIYVYLPVIIDERVCASCSAMNSKSKIPTRPTHMIVTGHPPCARHGLGGDASVVAWTVITRTAEEDMHRRPETSCFLCSSARGPTGQCAMPAPSMGSQSRWAANRNPPSRQLCVPPLLTMRWMRAHHRGSGLANFLY